MWEGCIIARKQKISLKNKRIGAKHNIQHHLGSGPTYKHMIEILTSRVNPHPELMTREESLAYQINQEELESIYMEKVMCILSNVTIEDQSELPALQYPGIREEFKLSPTPMMLSHLAQGIEDDLMSIKPPLFIASLIQYP